MDLTLATFALVALFTAAVAYLTFTRDLGRRRAARHAAGAAAVTTLCFAFVSYLAVLALVAAAGAYLLQRRRHQISQAAMTMGTTFSTLIAASAGGSFVTLVYNL